MIRFEDSRGNRPVFLKLTACCILLFSGIWLWSPSKTLVETNARPVPSIQHSVSNAKMRPEKELSAPVASVMQPDDSRTKGVVNLTNIDDLNAASAVPDAMEVLTKFPLWLEKAKAGDPTAMFGIYLTLINCTSFEPTLQTMPDGTTRASSSRCGNIPAEERINPLTWLDRAAGKGDLRAMLDFGLNAKHSVPLNGMEQAAFNELALQRLDQAAVGGLSDGFIASYEAYRSGWYSQRNNIAGAAYLLALQELSPQSLPGGRMSDALASLRQADIVQAKLMANKIVVRTIQR